MTIYAVDKDQLGIALVEKNIIHAIRHYNSEDKTITILMGKIAVKISIDEVYKLLEHEN